MACARGGDMDRHDRFDGVGSKVSWQRKRDDIFHMLRRETACWLAFSTKTEVPVQI
jgi:hypothetical protein